MSMKWHKDSQGLHADSTDGTLRFYVRRDGKVWRAAFCDLVEVAGVKVADVTRPMEDIDRGNGQRLAKAVCEAFDDEPWDDGGPMTRSTRAVTRAYATR